MSADAGNGGLSVSCKLDGGKMIKREMEGNAFFCFPFERAAK